jgi:ABC-type multidrug transport system fused ATPase/permease subunit
MAHSPTAGRPCRGGSLALLLAGAGIGAFALRVVLLIGFGGAGRSPFAGQGAQVLFRPRGLCCDLQLVAVLVVLAIFATEISPQNPYDLRQLTSWMAVCRRVPRPFDGAMTYHLGTDEQGRDILSGILYGLRVSLSVSIIATLIAMLIGVVVGIYAAWAGGRVEAVLMRIVDFQLSFPSILVALMLMAAFGRGLDKIVIALIIVQWAYYARTVRGTALSETRKEYIDAARGLGLPSWRIIFRHLAAQLHPAPDRDFDSAGGQYHRAGILAVIPRGGRADHAAVAWAADCQWLWLHAVGPILDEHVSRCCAAGDRGLDQLGGRQAARHPEPEVDTMSILDVRDLQTHFFTDAGVVKAVDGVSFSLSAGEVLGLVGESGSGKSVTGFSILRLVDAPGRVVGGQISFKGQDLAKLSDREMRALRGNRIAMIFQDPMMTLNPVLRIETQMDRGRARP